MARPLEYELGTVKLEFELVQHLLLDGGIADVRVEASMLHCVESVESAEYSLTNVQEECKAWYLGCGNPQ